MTPLFSAGGMYADLAESPRRLLLFSFLFLFLMSGTAHPGGYEWRFDGSRQDNQWQARNAVAEQTPHGHVTIRGSGVFYFVSPPGLDLHPDEFCVEFKLRTQTTYRLGYLVARTRGNRTLQKEFRYGIPGRFKVYAFRLGELKGMDEGIDSLAFVFGEIESVDIEYVKMVHSSILQKARMSWRDFWDPGYLRASSVNFIDTPSFSGISFPALLYCLSAMLLLGFAGFSSRRNGRFLRRAFVLCFVFSGALFALRMDYSWYMMWRMDSAFLGPKSVDDRISFVDGAGTYEIAKWVKTLVPPGEEVGFHVVDVDKKLIAQKLRYYLLPVKVSSAGKYILVWADPGIRFDSGTGTLRRAAGVIADNVSPVATFRDDIVLYRAE